VSQSTYELPIAKEQAYGLASMCAAAYAKKEILLDASGKDDPNSVSEMITELSRKLQRGFDPLKWPLPVANDFKLLKHRRQNETKARLVGYALSSQKYLAVVFRGTAFSDEWAANFSSAVPAVRSKRQFFGLAFFSMLPKLRRWKLLEQIFDMENGVSENAAYLQHLKGVVLQVKNFLDDVIQAETKDPSLAQRKLYITGHSLGGAAAIITSRRLLSSSDTKYKQTFHARMETLTFGAPPLLEQAEEVKPGEPPVYNVYRPNDAVPCMSLDLISIVASTPYHFGDHFILKVSRSVVAVKRLKLNRGAILGKMVLRGLCGWPWKAPARIFQCHGMGTYAQDMERVTFG